MVPRADHGRLRLRAAGAAPKAARALGLDPLSIRDASSVFAGFMAGLAGAYLSIGVVGIFNEASPPDAASSPWPPSISARTVRD